MLVGVIRIDFEIIIIIRLPCHKINMPIRYADAVVVFVLFSYFDFVCLK